MSRERASEWNQNEKFINSPTVMGNVVESSMESPTLITHRFKRKSCAFAFVLISKTIKVKWRRKSKTNCPQFLIAFRCYFSFCEFRDEQVGEQVGGGFFNANENNAFALITFRQFVISAWNFWSRLMISSSLEDAHWSIFVKRSQRTQNFRMKSLKKRRKCCRKKLFFN